MIKILKKKNEKEKEKKFSMKKSDLIYDYDKSES